MAKITILTQRSDFLRVQSRGAKSVTKSFVLQGYAHRFEANPSSHSQNNLSEWRVGFTASKRVGNAVCRNRAKRRLRALVRGEMANYARESVDYVLIARALLVQKDYRLAADDLRRAMAELHRKFDRSAKRATDHKKDA